VRDINITITCADINSKTMDERHYHYKCKLAGCFPKLVTKFAPVATNFVTPRRHCCAILLYEIPPKTQLFFTRRGELGATIQTDLRYWLYRQRHVLFGTTLNYSNRNMSSNLLTG